MITLSKIKHECVAPHTVTATYIDGKKEKEKKKTTAVLVRTINIRMQQQSLS
jgi:hypothetical protein